MQGDVADNYGPVPAEGGDDIKACYKMADNNYLYYMIEFWSLFAMDLVGETTLEITWDTNFEEPGAEWSTNLSGYGFQVFELGLGSIFENSWSFSNVEYAVADVIEIKIPFTELRELNRKSGEIAESLLEENIAYSVPVSTFPVWNLKYDQTAVDNPIITVGFRFQLDKYLSIVKF